MNIETANRLLQYRKKNNMSQEELAEKIGVSRQAVSKWERAEASPDTDNLISLAQVYGVSLDELLKGEAEVNSADNNTYNNDQTENSENSQPDEDIHYEKYDKVSFKNGIHVDSKDGDHVHVSFKDGVHVQDKNGDNVHVGWNGIHVEENGKQRVYTDENGNVMVDESIKHCHKQKSRGHKIWNKFPFFVLAIMAFLAWGFSGVCFGWVLSWTALLTIPLYYSLGDAIFKRNANHFAYPVLIVIIYMFFGFYNVCGGWEWGWIAFLTIPLYYWIVSLISGDDDDEDDD